jgi:DNA polymerase I
VKRYLFDLETDGFVATATTVHCASIRDVDTKEHWSYGPDQINEALVKLSEADVLIGHNIQRFDVPMLKKLFNWDPKAGVAIRDTMIIARVKFPNVKDTDGDLVRAGKMPAGKKYQGKHSLGAWGYRLGEHKGDYAQLRQAEALAAGITDPKALARYVWGTYTKEMHEYMDQDTATNLKLWEHLDPDNYSFQAVELEHRIARVCDAIEVAGVPFDIKKGGELHARLITEKSVIENKLVEQFGSWSVPAEVLIPKRDNKTLGYKKGVPVQKYREITFNPNSRDNIAKVLKDRGWVPKKFTDGGRAQFDEEVLQSVVLQYPEMGGIDTYLMLEKRISQLASGKQAWLQTVKDDGRIHGVINPMGTATSRCSHFLPNLAQIPNSSSPFGPECRELFYAPKGWKFLGADASGLELRALAHYLKPLDGGKYVKTVLEGDVHWQNALAMGLVVGDRDKHNALHTLLREDGSKRFVYATIYGAGAEKCGEIIFDVLVKARRDCGPEGAALYAKFFGEGQLKENALRNVGSRVRTNFFKGIEGFSTLKDRIDHQVERFGWLYALDERKIPTRSAHSALNFLIQSAGAILCKRWTCDAFEDLCSRYRLGPDGDFQFVLFVHDELQLLVREGLEKEIGDILTQHARASGEHYSFRCPLDSTYKYGESWAKTH